MERPSRAALNPNQRVKRSNDRRRFFFDPLDSKTNWPSRCCRQAANTRQPAQAESLDVRQEATRTGTLQLLGSEVHVPKSTQPDAGTSAHYGAARSRAERLGSWLEARAIRGGSSTTACGCGYHSILDVVLAKPLRTARGQGALGGPPLLDSGGIKARGRHVEKRWRQSLDRVARRSIFNNSATCCRFAAVVVSELRARKSGQSRTR